MSVINDLADGIVAEINGGNWSQPVNAVRHYVPRFNLAEMKTLHVTVVPKEAVLSRASRGMGQGDYTIDVAVQQKLDKADNSDIDVLADLTEELLDHFRGLRLPAYPNAAFLRAAHTVVFAPEHIVEQRLFTSVFSLTYQVAR